MVAAVLAPITVSDINAGALHCRLAAVAPDVNIMPQSYNRWYAENGRGRTQYVFAIIFLDKDGAAKPQTNRPGNPNGSQRFVRKVQKQYPSCKQTPASSNILLVI